MKLRFFIGCLIVAVGASCTHLGRNELPSSSPRANEIHKALNETVIPEVDLEKVSADQALRIWSDLSRQHHPLHFKFQYIWSSPVMSAQGTPQAAATPQDLPKVTVRRRNVTSKRLLDEICGEANLQWTIAGRVILVKPGPPRSTTTE